MPQISIRLPTDTIAKLDAETKRRNRAVPGARLVRADLIRILLAERLQQLEEGR